MALQVQCATCNGLLDPSTFPEGSQGRCRHCLTPVDARLYAAILEVEHDQRIGQNATDDEQATCFFHATSQAEETCDNCGRFLCGLCATPFRGATWCPHCISQGMESGKMDVFKHRYTMWDTTVGSICFLPIIFTCGYLTFISAPIALFLSIFWWKRPNGILPRTKIRYVLTIIFSLLQIAGWIALAIMIGTGIAGEF